MEIRVNFKILNKLSVFVYSKKIYIIKLIIYSMSVTKKPCLNFFSELDLIFNFFSLQNQKKSKKVNIYIQILRWFFTQSY